MIACAQRKKKKSCKYNGIHSVNVIVEWFEYGFLFLGGVLVGTINTISGGGSLLSLPLMITLGLPADIANGTNRIAILGGATTSTFGFISKKVFPKRALKLLLLPCLVGAVIGANLSLQLDELLLKRGISIVLLLSLVYLLFFKRSISKSAVDFFETASKKQLLVLMFVFFCIGIYGGFLQAGVGFMIIAALSAVGLPLKKTNCIKAILIGSYTLLALGIFYANNKVNWEVGLCMASGNMISAWYTSRFSIHLKDKYIKPVLIVMLFLFSIKLWL